MDQQILEQIITSDNNIVSDTSDVMICDELNKDTNTYTCDKYRFVVNDYDSNSLYSNLKHRGFATIDNKIIYDAETLGDLVWYVLWNKVIHIDSQYVENNLENYMIHTNDDESIDIRCRWNDDTDTVYHFQDIYTLADTIYHHQFHKGFVHIERILEELHMYPNDDDYEDITDTIQTDYQYEIEEANK